jgi:hypothetical protein
MQNISDLKKLTSEAKRLFGEMNQAETEVYGTLDYANERAWRFGKLLNQLKEIVGHGNWAQWRDDSFSGLDDRAAQRCQALDRANPNAQKFADLSKDSIRKYRFGYVPVKDRPKLKGDRKFSRPSHHSSVMVECNKLTQRIETGQYKPNDRQLLRDFQRFFNFLYPRYRDAGLLPG